MPGSVSSESDLFMDYYSDKEKRKNYLDKTNHSWGKVAASIIGSPVKTNISLKKKIRQAYNSGKSYEFEKT